MVGLSFGLNLGLQPIDRKTKTYRDQNIDSKEQLPMSYSGISGTQNYQSNVNINPSTIMNQNPMISTSEGPRAGYIGETKKIDYDIEDTDAKINQLKTNMFAIPGITSNVASTPITSGIPQTNIQEAPVDVKSTIDREIVDKKNRLSENINENEYKQLSEGGKAFIRLNEKRTYIADQIRKTQNIPSYIKDDELVNDFIEQKGNKFFEDDLNILNNNPDLNDTDVSIIYDKKLKGNLTKGSGKIISMSEKIGDDGVEFNLGDYLLGKQSVPVEFNERAKKDGFLAAPETIGRLFLNIPSAIRNTVAFITNSVINPGTASREMEMLPEGIKSYINSSKEQSKDENMLQTVQRTISDGIDFVGENPDILMDPLVVLKGAKVINSIKKITGKAGEAIKDIKLDIFKDTTKIAGKEKLGEILQPQVSDNLKSDIEVSKDMSNYISKSIKPTVIEKKGANVIKDFEKDVVSSIDTILDNKNVIKYMDEIGEEVTKANPETIKEWGEAIRQSKEIIYKNYADEATKAGEAGAVVNTEGIITELNTLKDKLSKMIGQENTINYIDNTIKDIQTKPTLDINTAQENVKLFNNQLQSFYRNPNYNDVGRTVVDALVNNILREQLDSSIEKALNNNKYKSYKQRYGALKNIEKEVNKRAIVSERGNARGLIDFTDFVSADMAVNGILRVLGGDLVGGASSLARGGVLNAIKNYYKKLNSPDYNMRKLFEIVEQQKKKGTLYSKKISDGNSNLSNNNSMSNIVNKKNTKMMEEGLGIDKGLKYIKKGDDIVDITKPNFEKQRFGVTKVNGKKISYNEGQEIVNKFMKGDVTVEEAIGEMDKLLKKELAEGVTYKQKISMLKEITEGTAEHEVVHAYLRRHINDARKYGILDEVKKTYNISDLEAKKFNYKDAYEYAEEALADGFNDWLNKRPTSLPQKVIQWFKDTFGNKTLQEQLYLDIKNKKKYYQGMREKNKLDTKSFIKDEGLKQNKRYIEYESEIDFNRYDEPKIKKAKIPNYVYHTTSLDNLESIKKSGLLRKKSGQNRGDMEKTIFAFTDKSEIGPAQQMSNNDFLRIKINTKDIPTNKFRPDDDFGGDLDDIAGYIWKIDSDIKPEYLEYSIDDGKTWKKMVETKNISNDNNGNTIIKLEEVNKEGLKPSNMSISQPKVVMKAPKAQGLIPKAKTVTKIEGQGGLKYNLEDKSVMLKTPSEKIVYRMPVSEVKGEKLLEKNTGLYTTSNEQYADTYRRGNKDLKMKMYKISNDAKVYNAEDVETLYKKLYGHEIPQKGHTHDDWINSLRKAEVKIKDKLIKEGYDIIEYKREVYDNDFEFMYGVEAPSTVILNEKVATEIPYKPSTNKLKELSQEQKTIVNNYRFKKEKFDNYIENIEEEYGSIESYLEKQKENSKSMISWMKSTGERNIRIYEEKLSQLKELEKQIQNIRKQQK